MVEYDGEAVVLHPGNGHVSVDGVPITETTKLPQGMQYVYTVCVILHFMFICYYRLIIHHYSIIV